MSFATGGFSGVSYVEETTWGVTPSTPTMVKLPTTGCSIVLSKDTFQDETLRSDRRISDLRHGVQQSGGDTPFMFRYGDFDPIMQAALYGTWTADVLKDSITERSFTFEREFADIGEYGVFTGCNIGSFSISVDANAIVTGSYTVVGREASYSTTPLDASPTAISGNSPFDSFTGELKEGGSTIGVVASVELSVDNGVEPTNVVGSNLSARNVAGRSNVSGSLTVYYEDSTMLNKFINETESSLELTLGDGVSESYVIELPRIKYTGGDNSVSDEGVISMSMPFQALSDDSEDCTIKITRIP